MPLTILHVEDHKVVADAVRETLELEGWRCVTCGDGAAAVRRLAGDTRYDLIMLDNNLPGAEGLEIVRHARSLPHRQRTPIIMLSASDAAQAALAAGADAFLRKPQDLAKIVPTIKHLLNTDTG